MVRTTFTDFECPACGHNKSQVWGHEDVHFNDRVCLGCRKITKGIDKK